LLPLIGPQVQRVCRERDVPRHGHGGPNDVEHLHRRGSLIERSAIEVPVLRDHVEYGSRLRWSTTLSQGGNQLTYPPLEPGPRPPCLPVPWGEGGETVDGGHQVIRALVELAVE